MTQSGQKKYLRQIVKSFGRMPLFSLWTMRGAERRSLAPSLGIGGIALALGGLAAPALAADAFSTDWAAGAKSEARLVAAGRDLAGFEVRLAPGAITYWRDPGDAGVPPTFDFTGSDNLAKAEPVFPAPKRIRESDGSEAFGYERDVVFPLRVEPSDPAKPVTLKLHANFAVCEKICLPAEARLMLTLPGAGSPHADLVEAALAAAPRPIPPKGFGDLVERRRRRLAPLRARRGRGATRSLRRAAGGLVDLGRRRARRGQPRLLQADAPPGAQGRRPAGPIAPDDDGRSGAGRDDG